jgi:hypothetical protein
MEDNYHQADDEVRLFRFLSAPKENSLPPFFFRLALLGPMVSV